MINKFIKKLSRRTQVISGIFIMLAISTSSAFAFNQNLLSTFQESFSKKEDSPISQEETSPTETPVVEANFSHINRDDLEIEPVKPDETPSESGIIQSYDAPTYPAPTFVPTTTPVPSSIPTPYIPSTPTPAPALVCSEDTTTKEAITRLYNAQVNSENIYHQSRLSQIQRALSSAIAEINNRGMLYSGATVQVKQQAAEDTNTENIRHNTELSSLNSSYQIELSSVAKICR